MAVLCDACSSERLRVQRHILGAVEILEARTGSRPRSRRRLAKALHRYADAGRFPRNRDFPGVMMPYFVDASETRCALAHLVEMHDGRSLVDAVASSANNAFVAELAKNPVLASWLDEHGLTPNEAARIQPGYCVTSADCICDSHVPIRGVIEGATVRGPRVGFEVTKVHGTVGPISRDDILPMAAPCGLGKPAIVIVSGGDDAYPLRFDARCLDETQKGFVCSFNSAHSPLVPKDVAIKAMMAGDRASCVAVLGKANPRFVSRHCAGMGMSDEPPQDRTTVGAPLSIAGLALVAIFRRRG